MNARHAATWSAGLLAVFLAACGSTATTFPNQLRDADGRPILLDDVQAIVDDDLADDEKREQLHDLGIEDEELIDALLEL